MSTSRPATSVPPSPPKAYDYAVVDVFAEQPLAGNALAVFTDARGLTSEQMQAIARETNLCETTFILPRSPEIERERGVHVRIFTVREELEFAGHPTLGTASWLHLNHPVLRGAATVTLDLPRRPHPRHLRRATDGPGVFGTMRQNDPVFGSIHSPAAVAAALGLSLDDLDPDLPIQTVSTGMAFCIVPLRSLAVAARLAIPAAARPGLPRPNRRKILPLHHSRLFLLRRGLARPHAVLQRRRSRHRLGIGLHHRLPRPSFARRQRPAHRARTGDRDASPQPHLCPACPKDDRVTRCARRRPHHSIASGRFFLP